MIYEEPKRNVITSRFESCLRRIYGFCRKKNWKKHGGCASGGYLMGQPSKKIFFSIFFYFFFSLPSVGTRQNLYRVPDKKHSVKTSLPTRILQCALCRVYLGLCRVFLTLGKTSVSRSVTYKGDAVGTNVNCSTRFCYCFGCSYSIHQLSISSFRWRWLVS